MRRKQRVGAGPARLLPRNPERWDLGETLMRSYLDHNATSPLLPEALDVMLPYLQNGAANPSSPHRDGQRARLAIEEAREEVAALAGASPAEIVFTSGGTESDNAAIVGLALAALAE